MHGKMTSDISVTGAVAPVPLDLSAAVSGLTQGRHCRVTVGLRNTDTCLSEELATKPVDRYDGVPNSLADPCKGRIMNRCLYYALGVALLGGILCSPGYLAAETKDSPSSMPPTVSAFIAKNCAARHHPPNPPLGIDLTTLTFNLNDVDTRWVWIHDAVRDGKIPPGGKSLLKEPDREAFVTAIAEYNRHSGVKALTQGALLLDN